MEVLESAKTKLGNKIELMGNPNNKSVLVVGVFHGDEPQGKYLIDKYISQNSQDGNLLFIPCLNPDGLQNNTRTNANGVDLNRNFPTKNWGEDTSAAGERASDYHGGTFPASEIETIFIMDVIEKYKPKLVLTLHAPYEIVNYDGPAEEIAQNISEIIGYPVEESVGYPTPGSFGTYYGIERELPVITLELDEKNHWDCLYDYMVKIFKMLQNI